MRGAIGGQVSAACHFRSRPCADAPIPGPMRSLIPTAVLTVWGAAIVLYSLSLGTDSHTGSYSAGQTVALAVGFLMFVGGARRLLITVRGDPDA